MDGAPDLIAIFAAVCATGQPAVLALAGPGATGLAAAFTEGHPRWRAAMSARELPGPEPAVCWFDEALAQADLVLGALHLTPAPWLVILTGRCVDAGPAPATASWVDGPEGRGATRVLDPNDALDPEALAAWRDTALQDGDLYGAVAADAALVRRGLPASRRVAAERLLGLGRYADLERLVLCGRPPSARELLLLALAAQRNDRLARSESLLASARAAGPDPDERADLAYAGAMLDVALRGLRQDDVPEPASPFLRMLWLRGLLYDREDPARFADLDGLPPELAALVRLEVPVEATDRRERLVCARDGLLGIGQLVDATRAARNLEPMDERLSTGAQRAINEIARLLAAGELAEASHQLDQTGSLRRQTGHWGLPAATLEVVVAARLGEPVRLNEALDRLLALRPSGYAERALEQACDWLDGADLWFAARALDAFASLLPRARARVLDRIARLPPEPACLGDFELSGLIGRGGMGTVWAARHRPTGDEVAIKLLRPELVARQGAVDAFRAEVEIASRLDHPAIVAVLDFGVALESTERQTRGALVAGQPFLVMERVRGGNVNERVGGFSWTEVRDLLFALLDALAYAHAHGVVHRDVKPANLLLDASGRLRLADFGLAGWTGARAVGTPHYMAPEQFALNAELDGRADLYALGCVAWTLLCGMPPYLGGPEALARAHHAGRLPSFEPMLPVPAGVEAWLARLLAPRRAERTSSAAEAAEGLLALPAAPTAPAEPPAAGWGSPSLPTLDLSTMLALPAGALPVLDEGPPAQRVRAVFERRRPYRPRIPTVHLVDRGDPELVGHEAARERLWELFLDVARTGRTAHVALDGPRGVGRHSLVRWVRLRARLQGLDVAEGPRDGLALFATTGVDVPPGAPWLVVWLAGAPAGVERLQLQLLERLELYWVVRGRLAVAPRFGLEVACRVAGRPALAVRVLQRAVGVPGLVPTARGLERARPLPDDDPVERAWWTEELDATTPAERDALTRWAVLVPDFLTATARAVADVDTALLRRFADETCGRWRLVPPVRALLLESAGDGVGALHRAAAGVVHAESDGEVRASYHAVRGGALDRVEALADLVWHELQRSRPLATEVLDALEAGLDRTGAPPDHAARGAVRLARWVDPFQAPGSRGLRDELGELLDVALIHRWYAVAATVYRLRVREGCAAPGELGRAIRWARRARSPYLGLRALVMSLHARLRAGEVDAGLEAAIVERIEGFPLTPDERVHVLLLLVSAVEPVGQTRAFRYSEAAWRWRDAVVDRRLVARLHLDQAEIEKKRGDLRAALAHLELTRGGVDVATVLGRLNAALVLHRLGEAGRAKLAAWDAVLLTHRIGWTGALHMLQAVLLVLWIEWPHDQWDDLLRTTPPPTHPEIVAFLRDAAHALPAGHPRREPLLRLVQGGADPRPSAWG